MFDLHVNSTYSSINHGDPEQHKVVWIVAVVCEVFMEVNVKCIRNLPFDSKFDMPSINAVKIVYASTTLFSDIIMFLKCQRPTTQINLYQNSNDCVYLLRNT